jgi:hypothetical protein
MGNRTTTPQDQTPQAHRYSTQKLMQACGLAIWPPIVCLNTVGTPTLPLDLDAILIANVNPKQRPPLPFSRTILKETARREPITRPIV